VSGFSAEWLALRERYDRAARNAAVLGEVAGAFARREGIAVVDLACGNGSTLRSIAVRLPPRQSWRLVDNDLGLLAQAARLDAPPLVSVTSRPVDLVRDLELALEGPLDLVTTSALLDLVSPQWLERLVTETAARRLPIYAALTYDGRAAIEPPHRLDGDVLAGFNLHQRTDKGFGPALGPAAAARLVELLGAIGYAVRQGPSDWLLGPDDPAMQETLFASWAELAPLTTSLDGSQIADWLAARRALLAHGRSRLRIGHLDVFAWPIATRRELTSQSSRTSQPRT
jgi:hypothetical protein